MSKLQKKLTKQDKILIEYNFWEFLKVFIRRKKGAK
jgi:hypothetical protein